MASATAIAPKPRMAVQCGRGDTNRSSPACACSQRRLCRSASQGMFARWSRKPAACSNPAAAAISPRNDSGRTMKPSAGSQSRLIGNQRVERPKASSTRGRVASCAATEQPRVSQRSRMKRPPAARMGESPPCRTLSGEKDNGPSFQSLLSHGEQSAIPATAEKESCTPRSYRHRGSARTMQSRASRSTSAKVKAGRRFRRKRSGSRSGTQRNRQTMASIRAARTSEGGASPSHK